MIDINFATTGFQTFFTSKEKSNCPLIPDVVRLGKKFKDIGLLKHINTGVVSLRYGRRLLVNGNTDDLGEINEFLEIVDYDPVKKIILIMGSKNPPVDAPIHWLIHHARDDINAVVSLDGERLAERFTGKLPATEKEEPSGTLELAKEILKTLRAGKSIIIKNKGVLFVGSSLKEVENLILKAYGGSK